MGGLGILCCVGDPSVPNPRISSHLARREAPSSLPLARTAGLPLGPEGWVGESAPQKGAGAGPLAACPQGSVHTQPFRPVLPPSLPYPRRQGTSLIMGWASQWGLVESKRIADGIPVIHQHE